MDNKGRVSIIVPMHNGEKFIADAIHSVLAQTYQNFELIIVDDGSTDNGCAVVEEFEDERIQLIRKEDGGVSAGRNCGLDHAQGEFVSFLDADDAYDPQYLEKLINAVGEDDCAVCSFKYVMMDENRRESLNTFHQSGSVSIAELMQNFWQNYSAYIFNPCWNKLYRKSILDEYQVRFPLGQYMGEDVMFNFTYMNHCHSFALVPDHLYLYSRYAAQTVQKSNPAYYDNIRTMYMEIRKLLETYSVWPQCSAEYYNRYLVDLKRAVSKASQATISTAEKAAIIRRLEADEMTKQTISGRSDLLSRLLRMRVVYGFIAVYTLHGTLKKMRAKH